MIILNLLPPEKKLKLIAELNVAQLKKVLMIIVLGAAVGIGVTGAGRWYLGLELQRLNDQVTAAQQLVQSNGQDLNSLVDKINGTVKSLQAMQSSHIRWSDIVSQTLATTSPNIQVSSLSFNAKDGTFKLDGVAKSRNDLLSMKDQLEALPFLEAIDSPISNLIKKQDIPFTLSGTVVLDVEAQP